MTDILFHGFFTKICIKSDEDSWTEHISNEEVLKLVKEERFLLTTIRKEK